MENTIISSSPHIRAKDTVAGIMRDVLIALSPAVIASIFFYRMEAAIIILLAVGSAVITEALLQKIAKQKVTINDMSAALTGVIIALNLPPTAPWYLPVIGSMFAIAIVKQVFGGLGHNFMNPAAAARIFLVSAFGVQMTTWANPVTIDAVSTATPMAILKGTAAGNLPSVTDMLIGNYGGCIGEACSIALLLGGVYLLIRKVISWHIPVAFIGTVAVLTFVFGPDGLFTGNVVYHVLGGGLLLGSIYMATDYVTSPVSPTGKIIMGVGCGLIVVIIRLLGGMAEGVAFSIVLMNLVVPIIDRLTKPKIYGEVKKDA